MRASFLTLFSTALLALAYGGCSTVRTWAPKPQAPAETSASASPNRELLNNAASLLSDLLKDEKNLDKILIIKGHSRELATLVGAISHAAAGGENQLEVLAQHEPGLNLKELGLPPGERAARKAIAKTKEHDLLFSSGNNFAFNLLITQADALSYGSHLAKIVAENVSRDDDARQFRALVETLNRLLKQVDTQLRALPRQ